MRIAVLEFGHSSRWRQNGRYGNLSYDARAAELPIPPEMQQIWDALVKE